MVILFTLCSVVWADQGDELIQAAADGHLAEVERLLEAGANVNAQNKYGDSALMDAVFFGHTEILELLISAGADENTLNNSFHNNEP